MRRAGLIVFKYVLLAPLLIFGCSLDNVGQTPPRALLNFPIALTGAGDYLLVANSNFNLRYNTGSLFSLSLPRIRERLAQCTVAAPCAVPDVADLLVIEVWLGSHANSISLGGLRDVNGTSLRRAYIAVRSDSDLAHVDLDPNSGVLSCGQNQSPDCDSAHQHMRIDSTCGRTLTGAADLVAVATAPLATLGIAGGGDYSVLVYRNGRAGLVIDGEVSANEPTLVDVYSRLPTDLVQGVLAPTRPEIWVANSAVGTRVTREVGRARILVDPRSPSCPGFVPSARTAIGGLDVGGDLIAGEAQDIRDFAFTADGQRVFVVSRRPELVAVLYPNRVARNQGEFALGAQFAVPGGPSRVRLGTLAGRSVLAVSSYDGRAITLIDVDSEVVLEVISGLVGPHDLYFDPVRPWLYVAEFRDSTMRVVSLEAGHRGVIATLGTPRPIQILR